MTDLEKRVAAVTATMARFEGRAFEWGRVDCAKMAAFHLRTLRGHKLGLSKAGTYKSALGAKRALARLGHDSLEGALDAAGLARIPAAAALTGDILLAPGTDGWSAIMILIGNGAALGFGEDDGRAQVLRIHGIHLTQAWRA